MDYILDTRVFIVSPLTVVVFSLGGVEPLGPAAVLGVVVDEHVVRDGEQLALHTGHGGDDNLEPPHVSRVSSILQTVLITLEEELQEEPDNNDK